MFSVDFFMLCRVFCFLRQAGEDEVVASIKKGKPMQQTIGEKIWDTLIRMMEDQENVTIKYGTKKEENPCPEKQKQAHNKRNHAA